MEMTEDDDGSVSGLMKLGCCVYVQLKRKRDVAQDSESGMTLLGAAAYVIETHIKHNTTHQHIITKKPGNTGRVTKTNVMGFASYTVEDFPKPWRQQGS
ncbi:hypothetical protein AOL_s00110g53 [Orbilia oligospora ATCC 24927]|uniref:Uncharacterized protein n=1 Tax=Arthrobotrys oligospora (strain ATCC 24927 / CBS 115.81 / DSM 1491) TaxID=756982 RepID=G1XKN3_ARTOA|nr:hypothetical protein AOL_s00110g53 [Orbilia oligospora ATCC 24927]EGX46229.1 hypothetical protein AOL_s00110g53 [Orbilia oligospora ATCC 24927]